VVGGRVVGGRRLGADDRCRVLGGLRWLVEFFGGQWSVVGGRWSEARGWWFRGTVVVWHWMSHIGRLLLGTELNLSHVKVHVCCE
jgi:hypothetical protein